MILVLYGFYHYGPTGNKKLSKLTKWQNVLPNLRKRLMLGSHLHYNLLTLSSSLCVEGLTQGCNIMLLRASYLSCTHLLYTSNMGLKSYNYHATCMLLQIVNPTGPWVECYKNLMHQFWERCIALVQAQF
jgi:hypothetical protein